MLRRDALVRWSICVLASISVLGSAAAQCNKTESRSVGTTEMGDFCLQLVASSAATFTGVGSLVSINDGSQIAFTGNEGSGDRVYVADFKEPGTGALTFRALSFDGSTQRTFRGVWINDAKDAMGDSDPSVAARDRRSGNPPSYFARRWRYADGGVQVTGRSSSSIDSINSYVTMNDDGLVAFQGLRQGSTRTGIWAGTDEPPNLVIDFPGSIQLRPAIDNVGYIVIRTDTGDIVSYPWSGGPSTTIATAAAYLDTGIAPGISKDGRVITFIGTAVGSGDRAVFASIQKSDSSRQIVDIAKVGGRVLSIDGSQRAAIVTDRRTEGSETITKIRVAFAGTTTGGVAAVFYAEAEFSESTGITQFDPYVVVRSGDALPSAGDRTVSSLVLYDPLNRYGEVAFWASFTDGVTGVLWGTPAADYKQNDPQWGSEIHGNGSKLLKNVGCGISVCADLLNYVGWSEGADVTPQDVNDWFKANEGFNSSNDPTPEACARFAVTAQNTIPGEWPTAVGLYYHGHRNDATLGEVKEWLSQRGPVHLRVNGGGHSVLASAESVKVGGKLRVRNPGRSDGTKWTLASYGGTFQRAYFYARTPKPDDTGADAPFSGYEVLQFSASDTVEFVVEAADGRRTGIDPNSGRLLEEIPNAAYYLEQYVDDETELLDGPPRPMFEVLLPSDGTYNVYVKGKSPGSYTVQTIAVDTDAAATSDSITKSGVVGQVDVYSKPYASAPGSSAMLTDEGSCLALSGGPDLSVAKDSVSWTVITGSDSYDVVRGDLGELRSAQGQFAATTVFCEADDTTSTTHPYTRVPPTGEADWILVRGANCAGPGTYDVSSTGLEANRDEGLATGGACP